MMLHRLLGVIMVCGLGSVAWADAVQQGLDAFEAEQWHAAHELWLPEAEAGDPRAQYYLGLLYQGGLGFERDLGIAHDWWLASANSGYAPAQFNLGNLYQLEEAGRRSDSESVHWWRAAALGGIVPAQYNLGLFYHLGRGVEKSYERAVHWYRKAAQGGSARATRMLQKIAANSRHAVTEMTRQEDEPDREVMGSEADDTTIDNKNNKIPNISKVENKTGDSPVDPPDFIRESEQWVASQPDSNFTVQLFAAANRESALRFLSDYPSTERRAVFRYASSGKPWYVVIQGSFASATQARRMIDDLPIRVRQNKPWIKKFVDIKRHIIPE